MVRCVLVGTSESAVSDDAPGRTRATDEDLDLIRTTAAQVFGDGSGGLPVLGAMGWLGLLSTVDVGGSGWLPVEAAVVAGEAGKAREELGWASATLGAGAVSVAAEAVGDRWGPGALDGTAPVRWVHVEGVTVDRAGSSVRVSGAATHVVAAASASAFVLAGEGELHLVEAADPEVAFVEDPSSLDTRPGVQQVVFRSARATPLPIGAATTGELRSAALLLGATSAAGPLSLAVDRLAAYLSERVAFGAPIASFQAIQHRIVDLYVVQRQFEAVLQRAARRLEILAPDSLRAACIAHAYVADRIVPALDECIQLSGGIGFVWEYPLHHEMRSALTDANQFGTSRSSRASLADIEGW